MHLSVCCIILRSTRLYIWKRLFVVRRMADLSLNLNSAAKNHIVPAKCDKGRYGVSIPLTRIQALIGERMLKSKQNKPCFYIESKGDVTELMHSRHKLGKSLGLKITSNAFFIRALALAAGEYPIMIGVPDGPLGDNIRVASHVNVSFAVNAPQGLVVPVIRDADKKTLAEIAGLEKSLTDNARSNKLTLEDMEGETIALSNLGAYGTDSFIGIVPPPASTILAVGNVVETVVPEDGRPTLRKMTSLTLAVDHRVTNPACAAEFLKRIKELLESPLELI